MLPKDDTGSASTPKFSAGTITVIGALIALVSASVTALTTGYWQLQTERAREQSDATRLQQEQQFQILLRATQGVQPEEAAKNLEFFVDIGYLQDPTGQIRKYAEKGEAPVIPAPSPVQSKYSAGPSQLMNSISFKALDVESQLMKDFDLSDIQAAAILGNFTFESSLNPPSGGPSGGVDWVTWSGPKRSAFEAFARQNGLDPQSDKANYKFLKSEFEGPERLAITKLKTASSLAEATKIFAITYLRPVVLNYDARIAWAQAALDLTQYMSPAPLDLSSPSSGTPSPSSASPSPP